MISSSTSIVKVIKSIQEFDSSIFDTPIIFEGYLKDFYFGNSVVIDDFIIILRSLNDRIINHSVNTEVINTACKCLRIAERVTVQSALFNAIYVNKKYQTIENFDSEVNKAYSISTKQKNETISKAKAKKIIEFKANISSEIQYGGIIHLSWACENPFQLILSNNNENMDVTSIHAIDLSATSDIYELLLHDNCGKIIDRAEIKIQYRENSFCIFCGMPICDITDKYCIHCGVKLK